MVDFHFGVIESAIRRAFARPSAAFVLLGEQPSAPAVTRCVVAFAGDDAGRCVEHIAERLPANGRVAVEEPTDGR